MKVYMVGIGGSSMSGICKILLEKDMEVCGSDVNGAPHLELLGVKVFKSHKKENIPFDTQILIYSSAVGDDNEEVAFARENHICVFSRGEILGLISRGYEKVVCVSGSHGKTTTTAMVGEIFAFSGKNASVHIGSENTRKKCGNGEDIFLCEACEYCDNFLNFSPTLGVITNMEYDHPDYFKSFSQMEKSFETFAKNCKVVLTKESVARKLKLKNALLCEVLESKTKSKTKSETKSKTKIETERAIPHFSARNLKEEGGFFTFDFYKKDSFVCEITLKTKGKFNVENALFACSVGYLFGGTPYEIEKGASSFFGVKRRLEKMGGTCGVEIFCDYAHHPTQIANMAEIFDGDTLVIFQPHTYSRTKMLIKDFAKSLEKFANIAITETYPARESFDFYGSGEILSAVIKNAKFVQNQDLQDFAKREIASGKYKKLLLLGAGDIINVGQNLLFKTAKIKE